MVRFCRVRVASLPMCHPQVIRSHKLMRYHGGNTLKYQDNCEGLRALPLKSMECEIFQSTLRSHTTHAVSASQASPGHTSVASTTSSVSPALPSDHCYRAVLRPPALLTRLAQCPSLNS